MAISRLDRVPVECSPSVSSVDMPADVVKFGDGLELDRNSYELRRAGRALNLERIPLDVLFLLRRAQRAARDPRRHHRKDLGQGCLRRYR